MPLKSRDAVAPTSVETGEGDSRNDNTDDTGETFETKRSLHVDGRGGGGSGGSGRAGGSVISSSFDMFEVHFPSAGPLGITFEWAVDPTTIVHSNLSSADMLNSADSSMLTAVPASASGRQEGEISSDSTGGAPSINPRLARHDPSPLPPISASPSSARNDHLDVTAPLPHALRIQSFPGMPPRGATRPLEGSHRPVITTTTADDCTRLPADGERQPPVRVTGTGPSHRAPSLSGNFEPFREEGGADSPPLPSTSTRRSGVGSSSSNGSGEAAVDSPGAKAGETNPLGGTRVFGPVAGRDVLRPGDVLVEVNGTPVAGPAARDVGILSFDDAVRVVEAAGIGAAPPAETPGQAEERPHGRPRVFKFRRETLRPRRPKSAWNPSVSPLPLPRDPSKGGWVNDVPGPSSARSKISAELVSKPEATDDPPSASSNWGDGDFTSSAVLLSPGQDASSVGVDGLSGGLSSRSRFSVTSIGSRKSFTNRRSSKRGEASRATKGGGRKKRTGDGSSTVFSVSSAATRIKADARRGEALLEPFVCPRQQLVKKILETNTTLRPLTVRLTNLSYWYQQRRLLGGSRHMHRRAVFDPRNKWWDASIYMLGDRPSDGKLVPILTPVKSIATAASTEGQALALAAKSAKERDANPGAVRGPKPPGLNQLTMLQTHISVLVVSEVFAGLSHADRLALVFTALHDELAAQVHPARPPAFSPTCSSSTTTSSSILSPTMSSPSSSHPIKTLPATSRTEAHEEEANNTNDKVSRVRMLCQYSDAEEQSDSSRCLSPQHRGEASGSQESRAGRGQSNGAGGEQREQAARQRAEGEDEKEKEKDDRNGAGERRNGETTRNEGNEAEISEGGGCDSIDGEGAGGGHAHGEVGTSSDATPSSGKASPGGAQSSPFVPGQNDRSPQDSLATSNRQRTCWRQKKRQHRVIRGGVKASFVGSNVEALPIWGALDAIAGSSLLVDCRTPAQWRPEEYPPTAQELWGPARSGHRTIANNPRVQEASVRRSMERVIAESKVLREAAPKFEHFDRFKEGEGSTSGGGPSTACSDTRDVPNGNPRQSQIRGNGCNGNESPTPSTKKTAFVVAPNATMGRTHPHFFHGLGPNARNLFMELYAENRARLLAPISRGATGRLVDSSTSLERQHHRRHAPRPSSAAPSDGSCLPSLSTDGSEPHPHLPPPGEVPFSRSVTGSSPGGGGGGGAADTVRHAAGAFAASGPPQDLDAAILDRYGVLLGRISEAATRIQRVRRLGGLPRAARRLRRRQRAALALQRVFRGHLSRRYASIWKVVTSLASTRLSAGWRRFTARRNFLVFRARARAGAIGFQALFRGHVARRYAAWCAAHYFAARHIQRGARGFTARCSARRKRAIRTFQLCGAVAILMIQKAIRGFLVRKAYTRRFEEAVRVRVIVPAAGVLQKCWRGKKGREQAALRRRMWAAATEIQRHARGLRKRMWWARVLTCRLEHAMATKIAAIGRGYIDRELMKARAERRHFLHTIVPASILIQSQWRGYTKRRDLATHKQRWLAALFIQVAYRGALFRRQARRRYQEWLVLHKGFSATKIQCLFRKWRSRQLYRILNAEASWRRTFATRIILRSWRSYKLNLAMNELKEQWRVQKAALELAGAQRDIQEIKGDLQLCAEDIAAVEKSIKTAKRRMKDLAEYRKEAALRLVRVERLIEDLTVQDMAAGWGENYDREWDMLTNCASMAIEEQRMIKVKIAKLERDLEILKLEIDDQEADLDAASVKEFDRMEALRRMEIKRGLGLAARDRCRAVRREKMRWAVRDVRRNVIKRSRKDLQRFRELARSERPLEVEQTISYEKRRDQERDEEAEVRRMEREARRARFEELKKKGEGSLAVREVYDAVISGVRDILATATFDARRSKRDYRGRGPDEVGPAASAAATAAAAAARNAAIAAASRRANKDREDGPEDTVAVENAAAAAAAAAAVAAAATGGAEPGGGKMCRECGGPRFGRTVCAKCGANANSWRGAAGWGVGGRDEV